MKKKEMFEELHQVLNEKGAEGMMERISQMKEEESNPSNSELLAMIESNMKSVEHDLKEFTDQMNGTEVQ